MDGRPKIYITYLLTGGGHLAPARAVGDYLEQEYGDELDIKMCDFFKETSNHDVDEYLIRFLDRMVKYPRRNVLFHEKFLRPFPVLARMWSHYKFRSTFNSVVDYLNEHRPQVVYSNHVFTAYAIQSVRKHLDFPLKLITFNTDPHTSSVFLEQMCENDAVIVASEESRKLLLESGFPYEKIVQLPFPIHSRFEPTLTVTDDQKKFLGLDPEKKTLLISFGGAGHGSVSQMLRLLLQEKMSLNVIVVTGKNEGMKKQLEEEFGELDTSLLRFKILGFVDNMQELLALSDITFIKPGASTTYESLVMRKPIIFAQYMSHLETTNLEYVVGKGVGFYAGNNGKKFIKHLKYLIDDTHYQQVKKRFDELDIVSGTPQIADYLYRVAREKK
jgi:UDP-N-acetylglucosamine:LPS N-acetylglucosamine transferase